MTSEQELASLWFQAHRRVDAVFRRWEQGPSPTQFEVMELLARVNTVSLMDAAARLQLSGATLARTVDAAARRGWIDKMRDPQDRRIVWLHLTPEGDTLRRRTADLLGQHLAARVGQLSAADLLGLKRALIRVAERGEDVSRPL